MTIVDVFLISPKTMKVIFSKCISAEGSFNQKPLALGEIREAIWRYSVMKLPSKNSQNHENRLARRSVRPPDLWFTPLYPALYPALPARPLVYPDLPQHFTPLYPAPALPRCTPLYPAPALPRCTPLYYAVYSALQHFTPLYPAPALPRCTPLYPAPALQI